MAQSDPGQRGTFALSSKLIISFVAICALLAAIGSFIFLSLRSLELLDRRETFSALDEVGVLRAVTKDADLLHAEVFRILTTASPVVKRAHLEVVDRLEKKNAQRLAQYSKGQLSAEARKLNQQALESRRNFFVQTRILLASDERVTRPLVTMPALAQQLSAYQAYQKTLGTLIHFEEGENRELIVATAGRIAQTRSVGNILLGLAILVAGWTAFTLFRMITALKRDKTRLENEVEQREKAGLALGESEERHRILLERIPDAVYVIVEGRVVFANPAAQKLLAGQSKESVVGQELRTLVPPEDREEMAKREEEIWSRKVPVPTERRLVRLDGTVADVETNSMPSTFEGKRAIQVVTRDITERKSGAERLRAQEKQYRLLFEDNPSPMWIHDPRSLKFLAVNQAAISHYGYSREEFLTLTLSDIRPNRDVPRFLTATNTPAAATEFSGIWQHRKKNGDLIIVAIHSSSIEFEGKKARLATGFDITERVESERKIREREASLALAQHVAGVGSWEYQLGSDGRIDEEKIFWSAEVYHLFGKSPEHFRPSTKAFFQAVHPADRVKVAQHFREFQRNGGRLSVDQRLLLSDGSERTVHIAAEVISVGEGGKRSKVIGTIMDITEQVSKAQALQEAEEKYRTIFANASEGIFQSSMQGKFLVVNPAAARIFGFASPEEMKEARSDITRQSYVDPRRRLDFIREIEREGVVTGFECEVYRKDGSKVWISENARAVCDANGKTLYFEGTLQDISERKRSEEQLREQAELLHLAHDAIMVRDMEDRVEFWNRGAETLYGWTAEEVRGRKTPNFLCFGDPKPMERARQTLLETGTWSGESQHLTKSGEKVIVRGRWSLLRDEFGRPKSKLVIDTDITAQKRIEQQFLRTQRLESIGTLASGIAHDLNNILLPVLMAAPILRAETDPEERNKFLDIVEASAQRGASIVRQVVTFARGADGEHILLQPLYLLEEITKIARQTFPKSITVRSTHSEDLRSIEADPTQLHQILLNLCINARDAMPNGGLITLTAENFDVDEHFSSMTPEARPGPHILLQVTDTGSGISSEIVDKIFDPFFTTKGIGQGTGLGLSTVAGIVRSHGGFIRVYSEPGSTTFKVFLPAKEDASIAASQAKKTIIPRGEDRFILLVDDEPGIRQLAQAILTHHGYRVILADDGPAALASFARHHSEIALVLSDVAMPVMNGLVLARALRKMEPNVKIIISTGRNDDLNSAEIAALHLDGFLRKPYTKENLLAKIADVIHAPSAVAA